MKGKRNQAQGPNPRPRVFTKATRPVFFSRPPRAKTHRSYVPRVSHQPRRHPQAGIFAGENKMTDVSPELAVDQSPHPTSSPDLLTAREHHRYCPRSQPAPSESPSSSFGFLHQRASPHSGDLILSEPLHHRDISSPKRQKPITKAGGQSIESPVPGVKAGGGSWRSLPSRSQKQNRKYLHSSESKNHPPTVKEVRRRNQSRSHHVEKTAVC
ncbi:hypothetical protein Rs2_51075 [Raphanus sativus]|nr:hypothetical protein Rs2_51075 [Raphanus sativus]